MRLLRTLAAALVAACVSAQKTITTVPSCSYTSVASELLSCKTGAAFCSSFLGRGPMITIVSVPTYTTTVPLSTVTYKVEPSTVTKSAIVTVSVLSTTMTINSCVTGAGAARLGNGVAVTAAAKGSCRVGAFSSAAIIAACECDYDATSYRAKTTKTVSAGTTLIKTKNPTPITTMTSTTYLSTQTATTTAYHSNCHPPSNATCANPLSCEDGYPSYYYFICGNSDEYGCTCGYDSYNSTMCFNGYDVECPYEPYSPGNVQECTNNFDCDAGYYCIKNYCGCSGPSVCLKPDVCLGDTVSIVTRTYSATSTA